jgi:hypothetical protein
MTTASVTNGSPRKSLAGQLDRLDRILDGLSEALRESVADAVKDSLQDVLAGVVREAVSVAIRETLSSPELLLAALSRFEPANTPPAAQPVGQGENPGESGHQGPGASIKKRLSAAWSWCLGGLRLAGAVALAHCLGGWRAVSGALGRAWHFRKSGAFALAVGALTGLVSYLLGPVAGSVLSGLSGAGLALAGLVLAPLLQLMWGGEPVG